VVSSNVIDVVVFAEISREIPSSSVGYSEDGGGEFLRNLTDSLQDCIISLNMETIILIFKTTKL
jgi:hypothetical protein